jgi:glucose/arabinose dehydrogenase
MDRTNVSERRIGSRSVKAMNSAALAHRAARPCLAHARASKRSVLIACFASVLGCSTSSEDPRSGPQPPLGDSGQSTVIPDAMVPSPGADASAARPDASSDGGGVQPPNPSDGGGGVADAGTGNADAATPSADAGPAPDPGACNASAAPDISVLGLKTIVTDTRLTSVVYAAQPPGSQDWFLVEVTGKIWAFTGGALRPTPVLDLSAEIKRSDFYDERGVLGMTFAPDYATSGKMYITLVTTTGASANHDLLLEYTRSQADPYVADVASRRAILDLAPQGMVAGWNNYHNGNTPKFGPDGMLYLGMGDGGGECNGANPGAPQDPKVLYGKILRLDPKAPAPHAAAGNPFASGGDARVYHLGLRNPFRFNFDSATGDLYIGDVGQWTYEEVDVAPAGMKGLNFGWPDFEADDTMSCTNNIPMRTGDTHTRPIHIIAHGANSGPASLTMTVVGGAVYRGTAIPKLFGVYLFGEYYATRPMAALSWCKGTASKPISILKKCDPNTPNAACFLSDGAPLAEVGAVIEGNDKELYIPANGNTLFKVVPAP